MEVEYLKTVLYLAKLKSFSKTAFEIPCSQSTVSRHVKMLEDELGVTLFLRSKDSNTVTLTEYGEEKIPIIEEMVNSYDKLMLPIIEDKKKPEVTLGVPRNAFWPVAQAHLVGKFYQYCSSITMKIEEFRMDTVWEMLNTGKCDVFLLRRIFTKNEEPNDNWNRSPMKITPLCDVGLFMAVGLVNPLSNAKSFNLIDLKDQNFLFSSVSATAHSFAPPYAYFSDACAAAGFSPTTVFLKGTQDTRMLGVINGMGIIPYILPKPMRYYPGIRFIPVTDAPYYARYYLCSRDAPQRSEVKRLNVFLAEYLDAEIGTFN